MAFSIALVVILALLLGYILQKVGIPPLVGMLGLGIIFNLFHWLDPSLMAIGVDLRMIALIIILLRAGFELSFDTLKQVGREAVLLSFPRSLKQARSPSLDHTFYR